VLITIVSSTGFLSFAQDEDLQIDKSQIPTAIINLTIKTDDYPVENLHNPKDFEEDNSKLRTCSSGYHSRNDNLDITFGETKSETWNFMYSPNTWSDVCYLEHFAVYSDDWGETKVSDEDFTLDQSFENSTDGSTAIIHYGTLEVSRRIYVPERNAKYFTITYSLTNKGELELSGVRFFETVDYDIIDKRGDYGWYIPGNDSIWENDINYFRNGFGSNIPSSNHGIDNWKNELNSDWNDAKLNGNNKYPKDGANDIAVGMQWDIGDLAPSESWQITLTFRFGERSDIYPDAGIDQQVGKGQTVVFNATLSSTSQDSIVSYEWDTNNDGIYDYKVDSPVYAYDGWDEIGNHTVSLRITDDQGNTATDTAIISVISIPLMFTIDLLTQDDNAQTSVGGILNYTIKVANKQLVADFINLEINGVEESWITLNRSLYLRPGESQELPLKVEVPDNAHEGNFTLTINASSSNLKINKEVNTSLNVFADPLIFDLVPEDYDQSGSKDVQFRWKTYAKSTSKLYIKMKNDTSFKMLNGADGWDHSVLASNLVNNSWYDFYAESKSIAGTYRSKTRHLYIDNGVSFTEKRYKFNIERNYSQLCSLSVKNTDSISHDLLVTVSSPYKDIYLDFTGNGSADRPLSLEPGQIKNLYLIIHAQDAILTNYSFQFELSTLDGEPITDYALANVDIRKPNIDYRIDEVDDDPITSAKTFRITNNGDSLTDLCITPDNNLKNKVVIQPSLQHSFLGSGESTEFSASPIWSKDIDSIEGSITAKAAGQTKVLNTGFACKNGSQCYEITLDHPIIYFDLKGAYCINAHHIEDFFCLPAGLKPEDVEYARIGMELNARDGQTRPYQVWIKINGQEVGAISQPPRGNYEYDINPSYLNYAEVGMAVNLYSLDSDIPGSYYTSLTDVRLIICVKELTLYICANSKEEAEDKAWSQPYIYQPAKNIAVKIISPEEGGNLAIGKLATIKAKVSGNRSVEKLNVVKAIVNGEETILTDNGQHNDGNKDDGIYANTWIPSSEGQIEIKVTANNCASTGSDKVTVSGINSQIMVRPAFWNIGNIEDCGINEKRFEIETTSDVYIESIEAPKWIHLSYFPAGVINAGEKKYFTAILDHSEIGSLNGDIVIKSRDLVNPKLKIPITGLIQNSRILQEAAKLRQQYEDTTKKITADCADMGVRAFGNIFVAAGSKAAAKKINEDFFKKLGGRSTGLRGAHQIISPYKHVYESQEEIERLKIDDQINQMINVGDKAFGKEIPWAANNLAGSSVAYLDKTTETFIVYLYNLMGGDNYVTKSFYLYDEFAKNFCENIENIDEKKAISYLKIEGLKIQQKPGWPMHLVVPAGQVGCQMNPLIAVITPFICSETIDISYSFNTLKDLFDTIWKVDGFVSTAVFITAIFTLAMALVGSGGGLLLVVGPILTTITEITKIMTPLTLLTVFASSCFVGEDIIQDTYDKELSQTLSNILEGKIYHTINDPEGPYISNLSVKNISLFENETLRFTFANTEPYPISAIPTIIIKSMSGDIVGEASSNDITTVGSNASTDFEFTIFGAIPGTYIAYAMVMYNMTNITPLAEKIFTINNTGSQIYKINKEDNLIQLGSPAKISILVNSSKSLSRDLTLLTTLSSGEGDIISYNISTVPVRNSINNVNITMMTKNITKKGIYNIEAVLIDALYPISTYEDRIIIANTSDVFNGVLIRNLMDNNYFLPDENIYFDVDVSNQGNTNLTGIKLVYELNGVSMDYKLENFTLLGNLSKGSNKNSRLVLQPDKFLAPGPYGISITAFDEVGNLLDKRVMPIIIKGNGTIIPIATTDGEVYRLGDKANISISLIDDLGYPINDSNIIINIKDPYQKELSSPLLRTVSNGTYTAIFAETLLNGTYTIRVHASKLGYRSYDDETHFMVNKPSKLNCTIGLSDISYRVNQTIPFTVNITSEGVPTDSSMMAKVIMPNNENYTVATYKDSYGNYSGTIHNTTIPGVYKITVETREIYYSDVVESFEFDILKVDDNNLTTSQMGKIRANSLSSASLGNVIFGMISPDQEIIIFNGRRSVGESKDLGNYSAGTELIFYLDTSNSSKRLSTDHSSCRVIQICEDVWKLAWEDGNEGDSDFNDLVVLVEVLPSSMRWDFDINFQGWERVGEVAPWHGYTLRDGANWQNQWGSSQGIIILDACNIPEKNINASAGIKKSIKVPSWARKLVIDMVKQGSDGGARLALMDLEGEHLLAEEILKDGDKKKVSVDISPWSGEVVTLVVKAFGAGNRCDCGPGTSKCCQEQIGIDTIELLGSHYYEIASQNMSWNDAQNYSKAEGGHLATLTSSEENRYVADLVHESGMNKALWIGLKKDNGSFRWITDEPIDYSNWCTGEPRNESDQVYGTLGGCDLDSWASLKENDSKQFVIEFDS